MENLLKYSGLVSIVLVIIGWVVIYRNACKIATRSETKSIVDGITSIFDDIEKLSVGFWLSGRKSRIDSEEFTLLYNAKLLTLSSRLSILELRKIDIKVVDLAKLSELVTYECEDVDRIHFSQKIQRVQLLLDEINKSNEALFHEFQKSHKPTH